MGFFGGFELFFVTVSLVNECVLFCRSIASSRHKHKYYETVFVKIEQFVNLIQVYFKFQKRGIGNFGCFEMFCIIVIVSVVFCVKL